MYNTLLIHVALPLENPVLIFAVLLFVILLVPIILESLKIPDVIGLIAAGAILGPHGLGVMERDSSIVLFGTVGLLYVMFLAGLETSMSDFKKNSGRGLAFGMYTFFIPMALGIVASRYVLHFPWATSVLLASMFASNTLLTYPVASKYGVTKNRAVTIAVGGTVVTCVLALLVLAVVVGMSTGSLDRFFWTRLGVGAVLACGAIVYLFPVLARWFFKRYDDRVLQYVFVLGLLFLASFLAEVAGLEAVIGAFLAGLALNRVIPGTSALMNRVEFVGNALFIPLFLVGVGMLVDYRVFAGGGKTLQVAIVMTVIATVSKWLAAWLARRSFRLTSPEMLLVFGLSNSQAAATLAAVMVGYGVVLVDGSRLLDDSVLNGTIVMILGTCVVASLATRRGARGVAHAELSGEKKRGAITLEERVLVPVSNAERVEELTSLAVSLRSRGSRSSLMALHVIPAEGASALAEQDARRLLENATKAAAAMDAVLVPLTRYDHNVVNGIKHAVKERKVTDLVLGWEISSAALGRLVDKVLARCAATTFVYRSVQPLSTVKRYIVVVPAGAEREVGFLYWVSRVWNLGHNLGNKLVFFAAPKTIAILREVEAWRPLHAKFHELSNWDDFLIVSREIQGDDGLIVVMSRRNFPSYARGMALLPSHVNKYFDRNNCLLVYPVQAGVGDDGASTFHRLEGLDSLDEIGKVIRGLFHK
ncbi:MAG: cation:proton antiporter [Odoribacteraceae bacterium]|jgi:Kef-type K+ transport system membrane component KefB|nr:cation:proton antiporter [Odoribacteraceae bacterium]